MIRFMKIFIWLSTSISLLGCAARFTYEGDLEKLSSVAEQPAGSSGENLTAAPMDPVAVEKSCTSFTMQRTTQTIHFPRSVEGCAWGLNDNMQMHDAHFQ